MKTVGIVILAVGLIFTIFTGVKYVAKKKVVDIGNLEISRDKKHNLEWSPLLGVAVMAIGAGVYYYGVKRQ